MFKIGPYSNDSLARRAILKVQEYVRAEVVNSDFEAKYRIDSFTVCVYSDSCKPKEIMNIGNKISDEAKDAFTNLKQNDVIVFKKIYAKGFDGIEILLTPCILTITEE
jgi:hypothetical protein